jgi:hypothetical protein
MKTEIIENFEILWKNILFIDIRILKFYEILEIFR